MGKQPGYSAPARRPARQRGNALVFGLMAFVLAAIGITIGVDQYKRSERSSKVHQTVSDITFIIGQSNGIFSKYGYRNLTTTAALNAGILPSGFAKPNSSGANREAVNQFGGAVYLNEVQYYELRGATLRYDNVPAELCATIIAQTQHLAWGISVNNNLLKFPGSPLDVNLIGPACATNGGSPYAMWYFGSQL